VSYFLGNFQMCWYYGWDLAYSIYHATQDTPYIGPGWATGQNLQIYGYQWMAVDEYNHKSDWSD